MNFEEIVAKLGGRKQLEDLVLGAGELLDRLEHNKIDRFYPDHGPLSWRNYKKHYEFFKAGLNYQEKLACCANRVGKTEGMGGYELTCHLTGRYPAWWPGRKFPKHIRAWAAGITNKDTRDIIQEKLLGPMSDPGSGLIPRHLLDKKTTKAGVADAIDQIWVKHVNGKRSVLTFKSYEQGAKSFQGTEQDVIWLDEEPPMDVYAECLMRLMTTNGMMMVTFTPLAGMSEVVRTFFEKGIKGGVDNNVNNRVES